MNGARGLLGAILTGAAALSALIACGPGNESTVVAKVNQGVWKASAYVRPRPQW
jgi:hypothetical protein